MANKAGAFIVSALFNRFVHPITIVTDIEYERLENYCTTCSI